MDVLEKRVLAASYTQPQLFLLGKTSTVFKKNSLGASASHRAAVLPVHLFSYTIAGQKWRSQGAQQRERIALLHALKTGRGSCRAIPPGLSSFLCDAESNAPPKSAKKFC